MITREQFVFTWIEEHETPSEKALRAAVTLCVETCISKEILDSPGSAAILADIKSELVQRVLHAVYGGILAHALELRKLAHQTVDRELTERLLAEVNAILAIARGPE